MEGITIRPEELRVSASDMRKKIELMKSSLQNASNIMGRLNESFVGTASDALIGKYNELKPKFDLFYNEMTSYAEFLDKTAALYEKADQDISKAAQDVLES